MIVFISLDGFYLSGQQSKQSSAVAKNRVILEASKDATRMGVRVGDGISLARKRCPGLEIKEYRAKDYAQRYEAIWSIIAVFTPMVETVDLHQGYLDITRDANRYGGADEIMSLMSKVLLKKSNQQISWGGGTDKWMAWLARGHNQFITPAMESLVLSKLSVEIMSLPKQVIERLYHYDIHTVSDLLSLSQGFLESHLGFDREFVLRRLTRHKEALHPNFPLRSVTAIESIVEEDEVCVERAILNVSKDLVTQLGRINMHPTSLRLTFGTKRKSHECEIKLSDSKLSASRIERIVTSELPAAMRTSLRQISIHALGLVPVTSRQDTLWGDKGKEVREHAVERLRTRLQSRYGTQTLMSGSELSAQQLPRFAQLIYKSRGQTLP